VKWAWKRIYQPRSGGKKPKGRKTAIKVALKTKGGKKRPAQGSGPSHGTIDHGKSLK